jgi:hypothetical protein
VPPGSQAAASGVGVALGGAVLGETFGVGDGMLVSFAANTPPENGSAMSG